VVGVSAAIRHGSFVSEEINNVNYPVEKNISPSPAARAARRFAVVLAGGSGTRLWPLSRTTMPKQLLALDGDKTLMQQTVDRVLPLLSGPRVLTVTHVDHRFEVAGQLHAIDPALAGNVLAEPMGRNTLPAIVWAAARIAKTAPDALIAVFSSDHAVADQAAFETAYGYIQAGGPLEAADAQGVRGARRVTRFVEKPNLETARSFLSEGGYYWNGGMFVFRADAFMQLLERYQPAIHAAVARLADCERDAPADLYASLPDISIDYGILEKTDRVAVVPVAMGWNDLGSWDSLYQQRAKDAAGNMIQGDVVAVDSRNNLIWSDHGVVATLGLEGIAVVQTRDATLVCPRSATANLKDLVARVRETHRPLTETHLTVTRPWGSYTVLEEGDRYKIKRIVVNPGQKLSMQMHHHRSEHWVVIAGTARIVNGDNEIFLEEDQSTYIPKTHRHRLENPGKIPLQIIEIQSGPYLEEDDIVRFGDIYGRS
jgi:mannose-1-phosphate guanylyltransferase/mannose-6-phosphate isomerase